LALSARNESHCSPVDADRVLASHSTRFFFCQKKPKEKEKKSSLIDRIRHGSASDAIELATRLGKSLLK
jgi:hypothetical protein